MPQVKHLAIIMDGNGRWAKERGLARVAGHEAGVKALRCVLKAVIEAKIPVLTVFAFSTENWSRPRAEVDYLMNTVLKKALSSAAKSFVEHGIKVVCIGRKDRITKPLLESIQKLEIATSQCSVLQLNIALDYGGRWEILEACKQLLRQGQPDKLLNDDEVFNESFKQALAFRKLPEPDLLIRTGGEFRLSNFMLWHLAYTELYFVKQYWPDFTANTLKEALNWFNNNSRRFGGVNTV